MIKVIVKNKDGIENVLVKGHANYEDYGKDSVCAAVSSITITACNSILALEDTINCKENSGLLEIRILKKTDINQKILGNMVSMLEELKEQYPKNIEIRSEE